MYTKRRKATRQTTAYRVEWTSVLDSNSGDLYDFGKSARSTDVYVIS